MHNGFFHERPADYDIYVSAGMVEKVGASVINGHVTSPRMEATTLLANVEWQGKTFIAVSRSFGESHSWVIVREEATR